jgi:hypothetical protein
LVGYFDIAVKLVNTGYEITEEVKNKKIVNKDAGIRHFGAEANSRKRSERVKWPECHRRVSDTRKGHQRLRK